MTASTEPIRIGIVGTGGMANSHAAAMKKEPGVELVGCADILPEKAKEFAARHGIPASFGDYRELLDRKDLNAVCVVTSDVAHAPVSIAALKRGLHVLCEKPLGTCYAETKKMLKAAKDAGRVAMINFSYRQVPAHHAAKQLVDEGALGRLRHVEASYLQSWLACDCWGDWRDKPAFLWRMSKAHKGGTLADIGCHIFDFVTYVVGDIAALRCAMKSFDKGVPKNTWKGYKLDADDTFIATADFAAGAAGTISATRWATGHANVLRLRVFGDKGSLVLDTEFGRDKVQVCTGAFHQRRMLWNTLPVTAPEVSNYQRFIRSIRAGKAESPTFEDGCKVQAYLDACVNSAETGKTVKMKFA